MAGGRGLRLHPLTEHEPKPLIHVGAKPMLETVIDQFFSQGFKKIWLSVNYRKELIKEYFGDGSSRGLKIRYLEETEPLGTGGAISLLPDFEVPYIVQNADVLTDIRYGELMESHARSNAEATVCVALHQHQVEYGVVDYDETNKMTGMREKPIENFPVNAGIYVLEPSAREYASGRFDMPDLIARLPEVAVYEIEGQWHDCGSFEDLARANAEWK